MSHNESGLKVVHRAITTLFCLSFILLPALSQDQQRRNHAEMQRLHQDAKAYIAMLENPERDAYQKPAEVVAALNLKKGEVIADIGSGSGYFSVRFADAVGPSGRVYGVDLNPDMISYLNVRAHEAGLSNLQTILAPADNPLLPAHGVDRVFICDTWHHIENQPTYLNHIREALKPGGRLIIVDFYKKELPVGPGVDMKIAKPDVISTIEESGFKLSDDLKLLEYQYFLVFEVAL